MGKEICSRCAKELKNGGWRRILTPAEDLEYMCKECFEGFSDWFNSRSLLSHPESEERVEFTKEELELLTRLLSGFHLMNNSIKDDKLILSILSKLPPQKVVELAREEKVKLSKKKE